MPYYIGDVIKDEKDLIARTPNLDWLALTKRPENWTPRLRAVCATKHGIVPFCQPPAGRELARRWLRGSAPPNVWLGVSVEDQRRADERIPTLVQIPARVRFVSAEPLIEHVDLAYACFNGADSFSTMPGLHWVIVGGESGPGARPFDLAWARALVAQCSAADVPVFVKQVGAVPFTSDDNDYHWLPRLMSNRKGGDMAEWPADLRVRQWPEARP